jgi:hypothetical protein
MLVDKSKSREICSNCLSEMYVIAFRPSDFTVLTSVLTFIGAFYPGDIQSATPFSFHKYDVYVGYTKRLA